MCLHACTRSTQEPDESPTQKIIVGIGNWGYISLAGPSTVAGVVVGIGIGAASTVRSEF